MHPKEARKIKNGTGRLTHLSLKNSEIFVGIDFTQDKKINAILQTHTSYVLYPSLSSIDIAKEPLPSSEKRAIFIIDATWACAKKILRMSSNLQDVPHISFTHTEVSKFQIKEQPNEYCLSTMESTLKVVNLLNDSSEDTSDFLEPFLKMNSMQLKAIEDHANDFNKNRLRRR